MLHPRPCQRLHGETAHNSSGHHELRHSSREAKRQWWHFLGGYQKGSKFHWLQQHNDTVGFFGTFFGRDDSMTKETHRFIEKGLAEVLCPSGFAFARSALGGSQGPALWTPSLNCQNDLLVVAKLFWDCLTFWNRRKWVPILDFGPLLPQSETGLERGL